MARSRSRSTKGSKHYKIRLSKVPSNLKPWMRHLKTYTDKYSSDEYSLKELMGMAKKTWRKQCANRKRSCKSMKRKSCKRSTCCSWKRKGQGKRKGHCSRKRSTK